jgi:hypothetical protein
MTALLVETMPMIEVNLKCPKRAVPAEVDPHEKSGESVAMCLAARRRF